MTPAPRIRVLIADDEPDLVGILRRVLEEDGHLVHTAGGAREARELAERERPALVLADLTMPDGTGLDVLAFVRERVPEARVILMTAFASAETAVAAMRDGATDYLIKPFALDEVRTHVRRIAAETSLERENRALRREVELGRAEEELVGEAPALREALTLLRRIAPETAPVVIRGETGTGKELAARLIHRESGRRGPFVAVNCGAIAETLLERELFGHERGAFTGADAAAPGLLEAAADGTLFLDEIGEMSSALQVKWLRVLDGSSYARVGGTKPVPCRTRFVAASNKDLAAEVAAGRFRQDLWFRLNTFTVALPPLRDRAGDAARLAAHFLGRFAAARGRAAPALAPAAASALAAYRWPGNVRELRNVIERAVMLAPGTSIGPDDLRLGAGAQPPAGGAAEWFTLPLKDARDAFERAYLADALRRHGGNVTRTAEAIGLDRTNLTDRVRKYGLRIEA